MANYKDYFNFTAGFFRAFTIQPPSGVDDHDQRSTVSPMTNSPTAPLSVAHVGFSFENETMLNASALSDNGAMDANVTLAGPNPMPTESQAVLITVYSLITLLSVLGNIIVIIVFSIGRRSKSDLRIFLINLALADLILAIFCMPFSFTVIMMDNWIFSAPMCPIVTFMQLFSVTASVSTNMAIGIDRFIAVTFPLRAMSTKYRSKIIVAVIWIIALALSAPTLAVARERKAINSTKLECEEIWPEPDSHLKRQAFTIFVLIFTYMVPLIILTVTYSIIARKLWTRISPGNADEARDAAQLKSKRKVVKMLMMILILFALCWLPLHLFFLLLDSTPIAQQTSYEVLKIVYYSVHILAMSNSFQNPIIYGFMNNQFRADLCDIVVRWFPCFKGLSCVQKVRSRGTIRHHSNNYSRCSNNNDGSDGSNAGFSTKETHLTPASAMERNRNEKQHLHVNRVKNDSNALLKPLMNGHKSEISSV